MATRPSGDAAKRRQKDMEKALYGDVGVGSTRRYTSEHERRLGSRISKAKQKLTSAWFTQHAESLETTELLHKHNEGRRFGLCVCVVVHNDADSIVSTLECLRIGTSVDCMVVVDTGSEDATTGPVVRYLERYGIPGRIVRRPHDAHTGIDVGTGSDVDRGEARTFALRQCAGLSYFILMMNATDHLRGKLDFFPTCTNSTTIALASKEECGRRSELWRELYDADRVHAYLLLFGKNNGERYWCPAVYRNDGSWRYQYAVHERARTDRVDAVMVALPRHDKLTQGGSYYIESRHPAARTCDGFRLDADIARLLHDHTKDPGDTHHIHFLAQSHRDAGNRVQALFWYRKYARTLEASLSTTGNSRSSISVSSSASSVPTPVTVLSSSSMTVFTSSPVTVFSSSPVSAPVLAPVPVVVGILHPLAPLDAKSNISQTQPGSLSPASDTSSALVSTRSFSKSTTSLSSTIAPSLLDSATDIKIGSFSTTHVVSPTAVLTAHATTIEAVVAATAASESKRPVRAAVHDGGIGGCGGEGDIKRRVRTKQGYMSKSNSVVESKPSSKISAPSPVSESAMMAWNEIGRLCAAGGDLLGTVEAFGRASSYAPERLEPVYYLMHVHRTCGDFPAGWRHVLHLLNVQGTLTLPFIAPTHPHIGVDAAIYDYAAYDEMAQLAFHTNHFKEAAQWTAIALKRPVTTLSSTTRQRLRDNLDLYLRATNTRPS
jgi:glycosyltransferase involved in cell wall biosynthesis